MTHERDPRRPATDAPIRPGDAAGRNGGPGALRNDAILDPPAQAEYDALADLFLGEGVSPTTPGVTGSASPIHTPPPRAERSGGPVVGTDATPVEGLVIGHLPVLASAWITQYARHAAERLNGWVGVIRLRAGQASVELVAPPTADTNRVPSVQPSLRDAVHAAAPLVSRWLIRVDELSEHRLVETDGIGAVTLLTGSDEAAVVASYRTIKLLAEHAEGDRALSLGVAVMGSTEEAARHAAARLARTVRAHLGFEVPLTACVARIGPARSVTLFRGEPGDSAESLLPTVVEAIRSSSRAGVSPVRSGPDLSSSSPVASASIASEANTGADPVPRPKTLSDLLEGLRALPARCPVAPSVEVAVDAGGRVHLLAERDAAGQDAVDQLVAAGGWAAQNRDWVALAAGTGSADPSPPLLHLFTGDARIVRRLLDADVRVHLLVRMSLAGRSEIACRPLN